MWVHDISISIPIPSDNPTGERLLFFNYMTSPIGQPGQDGAISAFWPGVLTLDYQIENRFWARCGQD